MDKIKIYFTQFFFTIVSNFIKIFVTAILSFLVPKIMNISNYGYWQLYVFYTGYVGFLHFGWCDGIYLREGGKQYSELDKENYKTQLLYITLMEIILSFILLAFIVSFDFDINKMYIAISLCIYAVVTIPCTLLIYLLQSTGRIKEFAIVNLIGRIFYFIFTILLLLFGMRNFISIILADILGWIITLILTCIYCKDVIYAKTKNFKLVISDISNNVSIGSKLLLSTIASGLIVGIVRIFIESRWDIETFGKVSLSLNFCNLILIFIQSLSIVMYSPLRKLDLPKLKELYQSIDKILSMLLFLLMLAYFPLTVIIKNWLPQYIDSIYFMSLLFPICIFESKYSLLTITYLKVLRKEKVLLMINIITLTVSAILSYIAVYVLSDLNFAILCILVVLAFKCIISELLVTHIFNMSNRKSIVFELLFTIIFILVVNQFNILVAFLLYSILYVLYMIGNRKFIFTNMKYLKNLAITK